MNLIVVHNPDAAHGDWNATRVERLLRDAGHDVDLVATDANWRARLTEQPDAFVAAGGDGTFHKLAHALLGRAVPVAILPLGTANNVAHGLGYRTHDDLLERVKRWPGNQQLLQVGVTDAGADRKFFIESTGFGAFVKMLEVSPGNAKKSVAPLGLLAIRRALVKKLLRAKPVQLAAQIDDRHTAGAYVMAECVNIPFLGPRLHLAPNEVAGESLLSLWAVPATARDAAAEWMATGVGDPSRWLIGRGSVVELETDERAHIDGEIWPPKGKHTGTLHIRAGARTMQVLV